MQGQFGRLNVHCTVKPQECCAKRSCMQAAFTPKELREVLEMPGVQVHIDKAALQNTPTAEAEMKATRMKRRVYDILAKAAQKPLQR